MCLKLLRRLVKVEQRVHLYLFTSPADYLINCNKHNIKNIYMWSRHKAILILLLSASYLNGHYYFICSYCVIRIPAYMRGYFCLAIKDIKQTVLDKSKFETNCKRAPSKKIMWSLKTIKAISFTLTTIKWTVTCAQHIIFLPIYVANQRSIKRRLLIIANLKLSQSLYKYIITGRNLSWLDVSFGHSARAMRILWWCDTQAHIDQNNLWDMLTCTVFSSGALRKH